MNFLQWLENNGHRSLLSLSDQEKDAAVIAFYSDTALTKIHSEIFAELVGDHRMPVLLFGDKNEKMNELYELSESDIVYTIDAYANHCADLDYYDSEALDLLLSAYQ